MDTRFQPVLQSFEERLAPTALVLSTAIKNVYSTSVGVVLPGESDTPPPLSPPTVPPPPPPGGM